MSRENTSRIKAAYKVVGLCCAPYSHTTESDLCFYVLYCQRNNIIRV